jgi:hypothetical protein
MGLLTRLIYKSKHDVCLCGQKLGSAWKNPPITTRSLVVSVCGDKQGKAARAAAAGGLGEVPFLLKKSLGKPKGLASNQTKI